MKIWHYLTIGSCVLAVATIVTIWIIKKRNENSETEKPQPIILMLIYDTTKSAEEINLIYSPCTSRCIYTIKVPYELVLCKLFNKTEIFYEKLGPVAMDDLKPIIPHLNPSPEPFTDIVRSINFISEYADQHSDRTIVAIIFTDGKHQMPPEASEQTLKDACSMLASKSNVLKFAVVGVDTDIRYDWKRYVIDFKDRALVRGLEDSDIGLREMIIDLNQKLRRLY